MAQMTKAGSGKSPVNQQISFVNFDDIVPNNILNLDERKIVKYSIHFFEIISSIKIYNWQKYGNTKENHMVIFTKYSTDLLLTFINLNTKYKKIPKISAYLMNNNIKIFSLSKWKNIYKNNSEIFLYQCLYLECFYKCFRFKNPNNKYHITFHGNSGFFQYPLDLAKYQMEQTFKINKKNVKIFIREILIK